MKSMNKANSYQGRQLLLLRHGKSSWNTDVTDFYRPLKNRGKEAAQQIGDWLHNEMLVPDLILSSSATRAIATANEVANMTGVTEITEVDDIYQSTVEGLLRILSNIPEQHNRTLIVGHNPGLEGLLLYLTTVSEQYYQEGKLLPTGTIAVLNMPNNWNQLEQECAQLVDLVRGRVL